MEETYLEVRDLKKYFPIKQGFFESLSGEAPMVRAVDGISFKIKGGEVFGLIGESGCGKTTAGRSILRLVEPTEGKVIYKGRDITALPLESEMRKMRREMQIIFQDPYESLNPRMSVFDIISEPIQLQHITKNLDETIEKVKSTLSDLRMVPPDEYLYRFPHELSGGQRQRVAVARAFVLNPGFIVADEPTSMLDASIRGEVLKLILNLIEKTHCAFLYITHDIALARYICDRIGVMYLGKIVETGHTEEVIKSSSHPYTEALLAAVPVPDPLARRTEVVIKGEVPSPINIPPGCRFNTRCPYAESICREEEPKMRAVGENKYVACHFPLV